MGSMWANDQRLLFLLEAARLAAPPPCSPASSPPPQSAVLQPPATTTPSESVTADPAAALSKNRPPSGSALTTNNKQNDGIPQSRFPSDFCRCKLALDNVKRSALVLRRCDDLTKSLRYINDDMTSKAIDSFSRTDLWRALGYRGGPEEAKFYLKKLDIEARAAATKAAIMAGGSGGGGGASSPMYSSFSNSSPQRPTMIQPTSSFTLGSSGNSFKAPSVQLPKRDANMVFFDALRNGGVLVDDATQPLLSILDFMQKLVDGSFATRAVSRTVLEFPPLSRKSSGSMSPKKANSPKRMSFSANSPILMQTDSKSPSRGAAEGDAAQQRSSLVSLERQKELGIQNRYAHDQDIRVGCIDEEQRFQRIIVLQVLSLVAEQQLESDIAVAKQRLVTCQALLIRLERNPQKLQDDEDLQQCVKLIPELEEAIYDAQQQSQKFDSTYHRRFHKAICASLEDLLVFNREVHRWNHHVHHQSQKHMVARRRTFQSCFTALYLLERGVLTLEKNMDVFLKLQLFEKLESSIQLARSSQDLLVKYRKKLCAMDRVRTDRVTDEDVARWLVDIRSVGPRNSIKNGRRPSAAAPRGRSGSSADSRGGLLSPGSSSLAPPTSASSRRRGSAMSDVTTSTSAADSTTKRWRFKLYEEALDEQRANQYDDLLDEESSVMFDSVHAMLNFVEDMTTPNDDTEVGGSRTRQKSIAFGAGSDVDGVSQRLGSAAAAARRKSSVRRGSHKLMTRGSVSHQQPDHRHEGHEAQTSTLPVAVQYFLIAILSTVDDILRRCEEETKEWDDDEDLELDDEDEDDDNNTGGEDNDTQQSKDVSRRQSTSKSDPLNQSMSSISSLHSKSSRSGVPNVHLLATTDGMATEPSARSKTVESIRNASKRMQSLAERISLPLRRFDPAAAAKPPKSAIALPSLGPVDAPLSPNTLLDPLSSGGGFGHHNDQVAVIPPTAAATIGRSSSSSCEGHSPFDSTQNGGKIAEKQIEKFHIAAQSALIPVPPALTSLEKRERDTIILRPGEPLVSTHRRPIILDGTLRSHVIAVECATHMVDRAVDRDVARDPRKMLSVHEPFWHHKPTGGRHHHQHTHLPHTAGSGEQHSESAAAALVITTTAPARDEWDPSLFVATDTGAIPRNPGTMQDAPDTGKDGDAQLPMHQGTHPSLRAPALPSAKRPGTATYETLKHALTRLASRPSSSSVRMKQERPFF